MNVLRTIEEYRSHLQSLKEEKRSIGFIPTMGYLHRGHLSLVSRAREETDCTVMSIFVNPLQFGPGEDFERYPRDEERDIRLASEVGVDILFMPSVEEMYPRPMKTAVSVKGITEPLCGASRPGHFTGVATVVSKLFHIIQPDRTYFGMKDAQQVAVIQQMVNDLSFPLTVVPCPTLREEDGLALSSRNVYLSVEQREQAPILYQALQHIDAWLAESPGLTGNQLEQRLRDTIETASGARIDYVQALSYPALERIEGPLKLAGPCIAALAVKFGTTRLIDNRLFQVE